MPTYAHPEVLVTTLWVADHLRDPNVRLLEVGWDTSEYEAGHIPGAVGWGFADLRQPERGDVVNKLQMEAMLSRAGIVIENTVVVYGGLNNLVAAMAFWLLRIYGHADVRLLDGGRQKWLAEDRSLTAEKPDVRPAVYVAREPSWTLRADKDHIIRVIGQTGQAIVDARPIDMYTGENTAGMPRGGHVPTAVNVPAVAITNADGRFQGWQTPTTQSDGTFKPAEELRALFAERGISPDKAIITYCVRGGLSTHMWFALTQLLGYPDVREYDRSWAEWGNLADLPVEK